MHCNSLGERRQRQPSVLGRVNITIKPLHVISFTTFYWGLSRSYANEALYIILLYQAQQLVQLSSCKPRSNSKPMPCSGKTPTPRTTTQRITTSKFINIKELQCRSQARREKWEPISLYLGEYEISLSPHKERVWPECSTLTSTAWLERLGTSPCGNPCGARHWAGHPSTGVLGLEVRSRSSMTCPED